MLKLYKRIENQLHYWETWNTKDSTAIIHWGIIGDTGSSKETQSGISEFTALVQKNIDQQLLEGYHKIDIDDHFMLIIEYQIKDMGMVEDIEKRYRLEDRMNRTLGWTGLGKFDGGSIGSGTMEVCCLVVDFQVAKNMIEQDLKNTEFSDYIRIHDESE